MIYGTVAGRLTKDGEVRFTASGAAVLGFTVACDVGYGDKKHAVFVRCSMWGKRGEAVAPYVTKGSPVTVIGTMDLREWESNDKSGTSLEMNVSELVLQGSKKQESADQGGFRKPKPAQMDDFDQDDIPF